MHDPAIHVSDLSKTYTIHEREGGFAAAARGLFKRQKKEVRAVDGISFDIAPGEVVGFLGPNGAGKTTTLKMLSGLLFPTGGKVSVLGFEPTRRQRDFLRQITLVMGNRNQLNWDIPALDSFDLNRAVYQIPGDSFKKTINGLVELLEIEELVKKPVRNLSLGERMKVEICAALLHSPRVLFLDEPTIGLDVSMQLRIRQFFAEYNQRTGAAILLTSHYMADVEALCQRVIVIHHGRLLYDGDLSALVDRFSIDKTISIRLEDDSADLSPYGEVISRVPGQATLRVSRGDASRVTARLLAELSVDDLTIKDPPIEEVIDRVFAQPEPEEAVP
jgi:ABC-2 type transport system ATP-binding protein